MHANQIDGEDIPDKRPCFIRPGALVQGCLTFLHTAPKTYAWSPATLSRALQTTDFHLELLMYGAMQGRPRCAADGTTSLPDAVTWRRLRILLGTVLS